MSEKTKTILVDELQLGMYVAQLDISWIKVPYFRHRRLITDNNDIKLLKGAGVKEVVIDLEKCKSRLEVANTDPEANINLELTPPTSPPKETVSLKEELVTAKAIEKEAFDTISKVHEKIREGELVDINDFNPVVTKTIDSLGRNNKALLALLNKSQENDKLVTHHFRVLSLSTAIAMQMGYNETQMELLALSALLHDAGWVKLPAQLFAKRKNYKPAEKRLIEQHIPLFKKTLCQEDAIPSLVVAIIEQHQELGDGSGYPNKMKLEEIFHQARLLAICDHFDEMTHGLGEQPGVLAKKALGLIYKEAEMGLYDPDIVSELVRIMGVYPLGSAVLLSSGEKAVIIDLNAHDPLSPVVRIAYDRAGQALMDQLEVNLAKRKRGEQTRAVTQIIDPSQPGVDPAGILVWSDEDD